MEDVSQLSATLIGFCNVPEKRRPVNLDGCPNVGSICIGCTMPGFPDKFMPFMNQPPGLAVVVTCGNDLRKSDSCAEKVYAGVLRKRGVTTVAERAT